MEMNHVMLKCLNNLLYFLGSDNNPPLLDRNVPNKLLVASVGMFMCAALLLDIC